MRTGLIFQRGNFVGREYFAALARAGLTPDFIATVGAITERSIAWEIERTGGLWNPPAIPEAAAIPHFEGLRAPELWERVRAARLDVMIQGGVGILRPEMLESVRIGFLNVHPGALPAYRGNACPEWALAEGAPIVATAHMIDAGIDTGPVVCARAMERGADWTYERIRAHIYPHCAQVLVEALHRLTTADTEGEWSRAVSPQDEAGARYLPQMPADRLDALKQRLAERARAE